jgi:uncharacterized protein
LSIVGNPVIHFEIMGKDVRALGSFYGQAFGWQISPPVQGAGGVEYTLVETGGKAGIAGGIGESPQGYDGHVTFYIEVPDVARALETVESLGAKRMLGPDQVPGGPVIGLFRDPEGHTIGLTQHRT